MIAPTFIPSEAEGPRITARAPAAKSWRRHQGTGVARFVLLAFLTLLGAFASAERYALLVAIDDYPIVHGRQLSGAAYDLRLMSKALEFFNFKTEQLAGPEATREAIITKLALMARQASSGDQMVFYFSGRGSIAPPIDHPEAKSGFEPTLVPYDGKETVTDYDLRMKRIEDWATEITAKGAHPTIIVDASFQSATRDDVGRPYNPMPRTMKRTATLAGDVREDTYLGPGTYLSATPSGGSAYEYLVNASRNTWTGAFTDILVNEIVGELRRGQAPNVAGVMREVQTFVKDKVRQDYMPGLEPYPAAKAMLAKPDDYDIPIFGGTNPTTIPPGQKAELTKMDDDRKARLKKLRIGLSFPAVRSRSQMGSRDADDMEKDRDPALVDSLTKFVASHILDAEVEPVGAPIDLIVSLAKLPSGGLEARVAGDEVDVSRNLRFAGKDIDTIMKAGLADHLERQALTLKLFRLMEENKPTWDATAVLTTDKASYAPEDPFHLKAGCDAPARLYVFDRDDADGIVQITFPAAEQRDNQLPAEGKSFDGYIETGSPTGKMLVRALFIPADFKLPPIGSDGLAGLLTQLRVIVPAMESGKLKWTSKDANLSVIGN